MNTGVGEVIRQPSHRERDGRSLRGERALEETTSLGGCKTPSDVDLGVPRLEEGGPGGYTGSVGRKRVMRDMGSRQKRGMSGLDKMEVQSEWR